MAPPHRKLSGNPLFISCLFLAGKQEAEREGVSVSELIRRRCEKAPKEDEVLLLELARQVRLGAKEAEQALRQGLAAAETMLARVEKVPEPV